MRGPLREADHLLAEGRYPAAVRAYGEALAARPTSTRALLGQAQALLAAERFEEALIPARLLTTASGPVRGEAVALEARALLELGRAPEAAALLQGADVPGRGSLLAEALLVMGDLAGAQAAAQAAGDGPLLAWIALRAGDRALAQATTAALIEAPPTDEAGRAEAAGVLLALGVSSQVEVREETVQRWVREAARREAAGDIEGTLRALSRMAVARPEHPIYAEHLGLRWLVVGQPALARRALEDALQPDPQREKAWRGLAEACHQLALPACEAAAWEGLLQHFGDDPSAWEGAHAAWLAAGEPARAQALWAQVVQRQPSDPLANLRYAQVLRQVGELDLAIGYARRADSQWPSPHLETMRLLAALYVERGDLPAAREAFERGLRDHPNDPVLRAGLQRVLGYAPP